MLGAGRALDFLQGCANFSSAFNRVTIALAR
jgi:hypothetical protein